ncbi:MAG: nucleotide exchange factor GrpE [Desulfobulbia bacterium]
MNEQKSGLQDENAEQKESINVTQKSEHEPPVQGTSKDQQAEQHSGSAIDKELTDKESNGTENSVDGLQYKIAVLSEALESAKDKSLRAQAEVENIRRRAANEQVNSRKFAIESFATELLSVKDSLDLAEQVELSADNEDVISKMQEGLSLTLKQLEQVFEKFSIKIISPEKGDKLNPELHQAMTIVPSNDVNPNCVLDVIQKGYQLHDRLLRPAMVVIAKKTEEKSHDSEE